MHIVRFSCGFANQLFQLCLYRRLELLFGSERVFADVSWYQQFEDGHGGFMLGPLYALNYTDMIPEGCVRVREDDFFDVQIEEGRDYLYDGYWQGENFLPDDLGFVEDILRVRSLSPENMEILRRMESPGSVSVHVRRGDFVNNALHGNIATQAFFQNAVAAVKERVPDPSFFVFSDDIPWCRRSLDFGESPVTFVTGNESRPELDLRMMSECAHHILSNSTFSWWGQRLGRDPDGIVVAPEYFFNERIWNRDISEKSRFLRVRSVPSVPAPCADPFFSIVLTSSRQESHYKRCLSSVLCQPFGSFELLVPDDPSGLFAGVLREYAPGDARIAAVRGATVSAAKLAALKGARGRYVLFLDANDYLSEDALAGLHEELIASPADVLGFGCVFRPGDPPPGSSAPGQTDALLRESYKGKWLRELWSVCCSRGRVLSVLSRAEAFVPDGTEDFFLACSLGFPAGHYRSTGLAPYYRVLYDDILFALGTPPEECPLSGAIDSASTRWRPVERYASAERPELLPLIRAGKRAEARRLLRRIRDLRGKLPLLRRARLLARLDRGLGTRFLADVVRNKLAGLLKGKSRR